jgi:AraC-like DNA-binding protein
LQASAAIAASTTEAVVATIANKGESLDAVMASVGIERSSLRNESGFLALATFTSLLEVVAANRGNATYGLELGRAFRPEGLGPHAVLFMTAPTIGDALQKFNRCFPTLQTNTRSALTVCDGTARFAYSIADPAVRFRAQDANFTLSVEYSMLTKMLGPGARMTYVDFEHSPSDDVELYEAHFACPIRFGRRENAICFPAHYLDIANPYADTVVNERTETQLTDSGKTKGMRLDLMVALKAWVTAGLCSSGNIDIEYAASDFGMSLRSFQRKLAEYGVNYLDIRNNVRCQIGKCLLAETSMPITSIALYLGYSETSAFSRSFKQQTGLSPAEFRNRWTAEHGRA